MDKPIRIDDIRPLTEFQRSTREHIKRLKRTGRPELLTVNGRAEIVVQDAKSYEALSERARQADENARLARGIADFRAGRVRPLEDVLESVVKNKARRRTSRRPE